MISAIVIGMVTGIFILGMFEVISSFYKLVKSLATLIKVKLRRNKQC